MKLWVSPFFSFLLEDGTGLGLDSPGVRFSIGERDLSLFHGVQIGSGGHPNFYRMDKG
jgi:hypothetical protein